MLWDFESVFPDIGSDTSVNAGWNDGAGGLQVSSALDALVNVGGEPLAGDRAERAPDALADLLDRRNGFYAFESALHVFGDRDVGSELGVGSWNDPALWRGIYGDLAATHLFFAEDVFGGQFSLAGHGVHAWDPETGDAEFMAPDLDGWARAILDDHELWTGHPLARAWQEIHGPLPATQRLVPVVPFTLGGEYAIANLRAVNRVEAMRIRAGYARELRDLPDGTRVRFTYGTP